MSTNPTEENKLWGGRFGSKLDPVMEKFNASISFDQRLWREDIIGSIAYANALSKANIVTESERGKIVAGLLDLKREWASGEFVVLDTDEDIHSANERRLKEMISDEIGGKLHTGRSRNDQVTTDVRLWLRNSIDVLGETILHLIMSFINRAENEIGIVMPGYTHLQRAQPILWSHYLLSFAWNFQQDYERLFQIRRRTNISPLGSGALAGNPFDIDRQAIADELKFEGLTPNSLLAVSDRDFICEFNFWCALTAVHLSRLAEDLIIYSTKEFNFVTISDAYSTGSSLMPQKKNADSLELVRGKTGRTVGNCVGLLVVLKGLPSAFNKDLQEDKEKMFDSYDSIHKMLQVMAGVVTTLTLNHENCLKALSSDLLATDLAYYLVKKGVPFRKAHELVGKVVALADFRKVDLHDLPLSAFVDISDKFTEDISTIWNYKKSTEQYTGIGGTSESSVRAQISDLKAWILDKKY